MHRVCLVGAGHVSATHAEALRCLSDAEAVAVCDTDLDRAERLAEEHGLAHRFGSLEEAIASQTFEYAHVLVPPDDHATVAAQLLSAQIGVLLEKPMATSLTDAQRLVAIAARGDAPLGVNHNAVFYPAYLELRARIHARALGPLQHLSVIMSMPRGGLPPGAHWLMRRPQNLAFETAVHPFSQIYDLAGPLVSSQTAVAGRRDVAADQPFFETWLPSLVCERATAQLCVTYAGSHSTWQLIALCEDGILTADLEQNRVTLMDRTRWGRFYEPVHVGLNLATQDTAQAARNAARELGSAFRPGARVDPYFNSMTASIAAFHAGPAADRPCVDATFATHVVAMCETASERVAAEAPAARPPRRRPTSGPCDVLVTGGTGFIGRNVVEQLSLSGASVRVLARHVEGLSPLFDSPGVELIPGDVADAGAVSRAVRGATKVVHLATGSTDSFASAEASITSATEALARRCLAEGVERFVFAGTIASLYLGDRNPPITGSTPTDPRGLERGPYGWAKARSEELLLGLFRDYDLPLCILRPGVVLGGGGSPFHSGFGIWRTDLHCVGWNSGTNPLPLVLVSDVARAILLSLECQAAVGRTYNLVGDVRLNARECVEELKQTLERPLVFHPVKPATHQAFQRSKWLTKSIIRRRVAPAPSFRLIKSMGCVTPFHCDDVKTELGWNPVCERNDFIEQALRIHGRRSPQLTSLPELATQPG